jgi:AbrB family looped-hinge helix DNA binding protein
MSREYVMPQHVAMGSNGRLVIPANVRSELGMQNGGNFLVSIENGQIRLEPIQAAVARAQAIVRRYLPEDVSLVDELTEDRRREAAGE